MRAVAERGRPGVLAPAEEDLLALFRGDVANGEEIGAPVAAIAVGLGAAPPAAAPEIGPALLELGVVRLVARDSGLGALGHRVPGPR